MALSLKNLLAVSLFCTFVLERMLVECKMRNFENNEKYPIRLHRHTHTQTIFLQTLIGTH
jgi:hypothetical protein